MTIIVGILCSDGVVIGADSAMAAGRAGAYTIEWQDGGMLKIDVHEPNIITAVTGAFGLAQRFNDLVPSIFKSLKEPYTQPVGWTPGVGGPAQPIGTPIQQALGARIKNGTKPYDFLSAVEIGTVISEIVSNNFRRTQTTQQTGTANGWGLGGLLAFMHKGEPQLVDFDRTQFHPEFRGTPDPLRAGKDRNARWISMGIGHPLADAFLANAYRLIFGEDRVPTVDQAKLVVVWTIEHVKRYQPGLVGGETRLAILEKVKGVWSAYHYEDVDQIKQQVIDLEDYIRRFPPFAVHGEGDNPLDELKKPLTPEERAP